MPSILTWSAALLDVDAFAATNLSTMRCSSNLPSRISLYFSDARGISVLSRLAPDLMILGGVAPMIDVVLEVDHEEAMISNSESCWHYTRSRDN